MQKIKKKNTGIKKKEKKTENGTGGKMFISNKKKKIKKIT